MMRRNVKMMIIKSNFKGSKERGYLRLTLIFVKLLQRMEFQNAKSKFETPHLSDGKYDHMKQREAIAHWILMHEQPLNVVENYGFTFMFKVNLPQFEKVSRVMAKNDVITVYDIEKKRNSVRFINQSESRLLKFSEIVHHLGNPVKKLILDCVTRWNSTYEMLVVAIKVKDAFPIFAQRESSYKWCPSLEDWSKIEHVLSILEVFYEATQVISRTNYPTSNVFLGVVWKVKHVLNENDFHHEELIRDMIEKMKTKFDKYWGDCNLLMSIGAILDPRYKMRLVDFAFNQIYNANDARINVMKVRDALHDLFYEYVEMDNMKT
nr:zinc finger BED domain-containing protein RICESLEEPER 2-like [Ipomoea batatas]